MYLTSSEFALNPTGYLVEEHCSSDFSIKRVVIQRQQMISFTIGLNGLSLTTGFLFKKDTRPSCYGMFLSGILLN